MHESKRQVRFLFLSIASFFTLSLFVYFIPPEQSFSFSTLTIPMFPLFFILILLSFFSLGTYLFKSKIHGVLIAMLVIVYLIFRQNDLTHPFFALLLAALFLVLELLFSYKK